jgi:hypothetical protein
MTIGKYLPIYVCLNKKERTMKTRIFTLLVLLSICASTMAQINYPHGIKPVLPKANNGSRYMAQRLIGYKLEGFDVANTVWDQIDSFKFTYGGTRGDVTAYNEVYDTKIYFDFPGNVATNNTRNLNTYNTHDDVVISVEQDWAAGQWKSIDSTEYTYDIDNKLTFVISFRRVGNNWVNDYKYDITYNADGTIHDEILFIWQSNAWNMDTRYQWDYNAQGKTSAWFAQSWTGSLWVDLLATYYQYDAQGNNISYLNLYDNGTGLDSTSRESRVFDGNGNVTEWITEYYDQIDYLWATYSKKTYTYDSNGEALLQQITERLYGNTWVNSNKYVYTPNLYANPTSQYTFTWDTLTGSWVDQYRYFYYYEDFENGISGVKDDNSVQVIAYPNPASSELRLLFNRPLDVNATIVITDIQGKVIYAANGNAVGNSTVIDISKLPQGMFNYSIYAGNKVQTGRFIKQ